MVVHFWIRLLKHKSNNNKKELFFAAHHEIMHRLQTLKKNKFQISNNKTIWWYDKDLGIQQAFSSFPKPKISYLFGDMQNFTPQRSLWYSSYPALNSVQFWILLFLLLFLSSSLEVLNLNSQPHMSMTAMWQSRCTSLQAPKLSCCLSRLSYFGWTLTVFICG